MFPDEREDMAMAKGIGSRGWLLLAVIGFWLVAQPAQAQDELFVTNVSGTESVTVHAGTASGNAAPLRSLSGGATGLSSPGAVAVDRVHGELIVANQGGSIKAYPLTASGNTAALRTISGAATGLSGPVGVAVDLAHDELFVVNPNSSSVTVYSRTANGNVAPLRTLAGGLTGLAGPIGIALDLLHDELFVTNNGISTVTVYSRSAGGNTAPLRTLAGATTGLGFPNGLAVDVLHNELVVANAAGPPSVTVYNRTASGNTAPLRTLGGALTGLAFPIGLVLDLAHNELSVTNTSANTVTVYGRTAAGNTAPLRTLGGPSTGLSGPSGLAVTPRIGLRASVNQPTFTVGQTVTATFGIDNPGLPGAADLYVAVLLPDGSMAFFTASGAVALGHVFDPTSFRPLVTGVSLTSPFAALVPSFFAYQITGTEPRGGYSLVFLVVQAGALANGSATGDEILGLALAPLSLL